jgi:hypothetical protein
MNKYEDSLDNYSNVADDKNRQNQEYKIPSLHPLTSVLL